MVKSIFRPHRFVLPTSRLSMILFLKAFFLCLKRTVHYALLKNCSLRFAKGLPQPYLLPYQTGGKNEGRNESVRFSRKVVAIKFFHSGIPPLKAVSCSETSLHCPYPCKSVNYLSRTTSFLRLFFFFWTIIRLVLKEGCTVCLSIVISLPA